MFYFTYGENKQNKLLRNAFFVGILEAAAKTNCVADPKQKFRIRCRIRIRPEGIFGFRYPDSNPDSNQDPNPGFGSSADPEPDPDPDPGGGGEGVGQPKMCIPPGKILGTPLVIYDF